MISIADPLFTSHAHPDPKRVVAAALNFVSLFLAARPMFELPLLSLSSIRSEIPALRAARLRRRAESSARAPETAKEVRA